MLHVRRIPVIAVVESVCASSSRPWGGTAREHGSCTGPFFSSQSIPKIAPPLPLRHPPTDTHCASLTTCPTPSRLPLPLGRLFDHGPISRPWRAPPNSPYTSRRPTDCDAQNRGLHAGIHAFCPLPAKHSNSMHCARLTSARPPRRVLSNCGSEGQSGCLWASSGNWLWRGGEKPACLAVVVASEKATLKTGG